MRYGSLCSGIGGLDLAVEACWPDAAPAWFCESDPHARMVLARHWPGVTIHPDLKTQDWSAVEPVELVCAGYPCQPFSHAGRRGGAGDPRHLWPYVIAAVRLLRPRLVVLENVAGHLGLGFDAVLGDLAEAGFDAEWTAVRASDVGACHRRERLFVVATDATGRGVQRQAGRDQADGADASGPTGWLGRSDSEAAADAGSQRRPQDAGGPSGGQGGERGRGGHHVVGSADEGLRPVGIVGQPPDTADGSPRRGHADGCHHAPADAARVGLQRGGESRGRRDGSEDDRGPAPDTDQPGLEGPQPAQRHVVPAWGDYEPAVRRWEHVLGRAAPAPTDEKGRLSVDFVEWMMGFAPGWVDGLTRTAALRCLGNAVVPQQGALALAGLTVEATAETDTSPAATPADAIDANDLAERAAEYPPAEQHRWGR